MWNRTRLTGWPLIAATLALTSAVAIWINTVFFSMPWVRSLPDATAGWLTPTLLAGWILLGLTGLLLLGLAQLRPDDLGLRKTDVLPALLLALALWACIQIGNLVAAVLAQGSPAVHSGWEARGVGGVLGGLAAQLFGSALAEETLFRGFLLSQIHLLLARRHRQGVALGGAVLLSQGLFALSHLPNRLVMGTPAGSLAGDLLMLFFVGVVFAMLFVVTRNLFLVVGVHALGNAPVLLWEGSGGQSSMVLLAVTTILMLVWRPVVSRIAHQPQPA